MTNECETLILVPTALEMNLLRAVLPADAFSGQRQMSDRFELCGFGAVAAAARTSQLLSLYQPRRVLLIGIAGSLGRRVQVGSAVSFRRVVCEGIGAGSGQHFLSASAMGWQHWAGSVSDLQDSQDIAARNAIGDVLDVGELHFEIGNRGDRTANNIEVNQEAVITCPVILGCCAASGNSEDAERRAVRYPEALAEDMESFGVAVACRFFGVPLKIIRGISNEAGDRLVRNWHIREGLDAAAQLLLQILGQV